MWDDTFYAPQKRHRITFLWLIPPLVWSLKSSNLSSISFQMGKTFWGLASAAVEQSRRKASMVAQGDGKFGIEADPRIPPNQKKKRFVTNFMQFKSFDRRISYSCYSFARDILIVVLTTKYAKRRLKLNLRSFVFYFTFFSPSLPFFRRSPGSQGQILVQHRRGPRGRDLLHQERGLRHAQQLQQAQTAAAVRTYVQCAVEEVEIGDQRRKKENPGNSRQRFF